MECKTQNFLRGWLLLLVLKECLVECATLCVKSEIILVVVAAAVAVAVPFVVVLSVVVVVLLSL